MNISELASNIDRSVFITRWALDYIEDTLPDYLDCETYSCDLGSLLTEAPNVNGIYEENSRKFIADHFNDASDEYQYEKDNFGEVLHNPFFDPEGFVVCMLINTVESILANIPFVDENWNNKITLTQDVVNNILNWISETESNV